MVTDKILNGLWEQCYEIGKGGMGTVVAAIKKGSNTPEHVIKIINFAGLNLQDQKYTLTRFQEEVSILEKLSHPGLPKVYDSFIINNAAHIVMDYIKGADLSKSLSLRVTNNNKFTQEELISILYQVTDILKYLHTQNPPIIFRDIKPSNIMMTIEGKVYLIDFGIARRIVNVNKQSATQIQQTLIGTPGFAAPEQVIGHANQLSDLYSLGRTIYVLATGLDICDPSQVKNPFCLPNIKSLRADLDKNFIFIVDKMIEIDQTKRFQSAGELSSAIEKHYSNIICPQHNIANVASSPQAVKANVTNNLTSPGLNNLNFCPDPKAKNIYENLLFVNNGNQIEALNVLMKYGYRPTDACSMKEFCEILSSTHKNNMFGKDQALMDQLIEYGYLPTEAYSMKEISGIIYSNDSINVLFKKIKDWKISSVVEVLSYWSDQKIINYFIKHPDNLRVMFESHNGQLKEIIEYISPIIIKNVDIKKFVVKKIRQYYCKKVNNDICREEIAFLFYCAFYFYGENAIEYIINDIIFLRKSMNGNHAYNFVGALLVSILVKCSSYFGVLHKIEEMTEVIVKQVILNVNEIYLYHTEVIFENVFLKCFPLNLHTMDMLLDKFERNVIKSETDRSNWLEYIADKIYKHSESCKVYEHEFDYCIKIVNKVKRLFDIYNTKIRIKYSFLQQLFPFVGQSLIRYKALYDLDISSVRQDLSDPNQFNIADMK